MEKTIAYRHPLDIAASTPEEYVAEVYRRLDESEADFAAGRCVNAWDALRELREELGV